MNIRTFAKVLTTLLLMSACESSNPVPQTTPATEKSAIEAETEIQTLPDFEVQLLYESSLKSEGSWVALTVDPEGRLIVSDQHGKGMYRISVDGESGEPEIEIEKLFMPISGAHGLTWAFDYLYANVNGRGLYRLRDSNGDDQLNLMEFLGGPKEGGDHGNHAILPDEDGKGLYVVNGNYTPTPDFTSSRLSNWKEDILLPRQWDVSGYARGIFAPGGYVARINPEASEWEMISAGYRNVYDVAINQHGELFTFDSDMEWDMGMPWYRPTRLLHVVSGSDYGWRSGSGKWKEYYEDSLPPLLNIGPGSPTGLLFGTGARFPARYQRALYGLDWAFGTIYAFHLTPEGATYRAEAEKFLSGSSLPVTDAVIGKDGAMYFITGGRNNASKLYRVIYKGNKSTDSASPIDSPKAKAAREQRYKLEAFHGRQDSRALKVAWPYLDSNDRYLRHAARVAIESRPTDIWAEKALSEKRPQARITALVALARTGSKDYRGDAIRSLLELDEAELSTGQKLGYLRAMALVFMRLGNPGEEERDHIVSVLQRLLPHEDIRVNTELVRLLVYLKDSGVIEKALTLMQNTDRLSSEPDWIAISDQNKHYGGTTKKMLESPPPVTGLEYAFMLRNLRDGWTIEQRRDYFTFINEAAGRMGGSSYAGFLEKMRNDALSNATQEEHEAVADITGVSLVQDLPFEVRPPEGPGRDWTLNESIMAVADHLYDRNFENGRNAFFATGCASCHRFNGFGGNTGPDLSTVGRRTSVAGLLEDIIQPSSLILDQYGSSEVELKNGDTLTGLVVEEVDHLKVYPRDPGQPPVEVARDQVVSVEKVNVSPMPPGLINSLNADELRDLIAYLRSGGNPDSKWFKEMGK